MTVPLTGQVTISFDGTSVRVEAPGKNGMREKIEGILFSDLPIEIQHNILSQIEAARDKNRRELMELQRNHVQYAYDNYGTGAHDLVQKVWGSDWAESRILKSRLRKLDPKIAQPGQYDPITGKIKSKPEKEILDLDL